jgi:hypothetical protein
MVYIVKSVTDNAPNCLSCDWQTLCGSTKKLLICAPNQGFIDYIDASFNGGASVGNRCAGSDTYVSFSTNAGSSCGWLFLIDIWQAYADAQWTSSVDIRVYAYSPFVFPDTRYSYAYISDGVGTSLADSLLKTVPNTVNTCPLDLWVTITVTDTGDITIV